MKVQTQKKILIIQTAFIGDVVLASSLIESIHEAEPESEIHFLLRKGNEGLFAGHPFLGQIIIWDKSNKYSSLKEVISEIRKSRYDLLINLQRFFSTGLISFLSRAKRKHGFSQNPFSFSYDFKLPFSTEKGVHEIDRNFNLLSSDNKKLQKLRPKLYPESQDRTRAKELVGEGSYLTISPGSVWFTKQAPISLWKEFISALPEDQRVIILGSGADYQLGETLRDEKGERVLNLCGKTNFLETAAIMEGSAINYSNDSAPLHLSSSVNAPTFAVYCSTIPEFGFGPLSDFSRVAEIKNLECRPCNLHGKKECPLAHFKCGNLHGPDPLLKAFEDVITFGKGKENEV